MDVKKEKINKNMKKEYKYDLKDDYTVLLEEVNGVFSYTYVIYNESDVYRQVMGSVTLMDDDNGLMKVQYFNASNHVTFVVIINDLRNMNITPSL